MPVVWCILNGSRVQDLLILDWRNGLSQSELSWHMPVKLVKKWCTPSFPTAYVPLQHSPLFKNSYVLVTSKNHDCSYMDTTQTIGTSQQ